MNGAVRILARSSRGTERVKAYAFTSKDPPTEIQLWNTGDNATDYGVHRWTDRSVQEVTARYNERGNPLLVDVEHNGAALLDGEPAVTGGHAALEIRDGAPWLKFDWSSYAIEQIASRQRLFLSPEYDIDPNSNEIIRLYRVSLVADPGTFRARVLASAANPEESSMDPTLAAIMSILNTVEDPVAAVAAVKDLVANMADASDSASDPVDPPADSEPQPAFAAADTSKSDDAKAISAAAEKAVAPAATAVAASAPAPATPAPAVDVEAVRATREIAKKSENVLRDILLAQGGHRLQPSIRTWASSQSLDVVRGLIAAAPDVAPATPVKVSATRGATHGKGDVRPGLQGAELEDLQRQMGTFKASTPKEIHQNDRGDWVFPTVTPTEYRAIKAAAAAKAGK